MAIYCYHSVEPAWDSALAVGPSAFARHCEWLVSTKTVHDLPEAVSRLDRSWRLPSREAAVTFDDGFAALYDHAFPVLRRLRVPATIFVVAATLTPEGKAVDWVDRPPAEPLRTLTLEQVLEMQDAGIRFGSHSLEHHVLTELSDAECERDLTTSRELLEDLLGRPVPFLAYPRGRHDERVRRAAARAGYSHAFSLPEGPERPSAFAVPRVGVYPGNGTRTLRLKSARVYPAVRGSKLWSLVRGGGAAAPG